MKGNRASGLRKGYSGPSLHGGNDPDQKGITTQGDFRQASHTIQKKLFLVHPLPGWTPIIGRDQ